MENREIEGLLDQGDRSVSSFERTNKSLVQKFQYFLHANQTAVSLLVLATSVVLFAILVGYKIFSAYALSLIVQQVTITAIIGAAQTLVILTAGIDLSVGAIMALSSVVMGASIFRYGIPVPIAIVCGFCFGAMCGVINGALVALIRLPPFIVTLGTLLVYSAASHIYTGGEAIGAQDIEMKASLLLLFGNSIDVGGATLTFGVISMVLLVGLLWYILNFTAWGRHVYAVGDNPEAAKLSGLPVTRILVTVYTVSGVICSFAGWVLVGRIHYIAPGLGQFANIESITAAVIGGISLFGGRGSVLGMLFGALTVGVLSLGLRLFVADAQWAYMSIGVFIIGAVAVDRWVKRITL
jgi:fructose transport system permease protein